MSARPLLDVPAAPIERLGKYDIVGVLGQGAMGIVYDAIDRGINRRVAVKAIRAPLLGGDAHDIAATQRFHTEAQAAGRLTHPNIVSIYEYGEEGTESDARRFIAMEFVDGVSLLELTAAQRRLPTDDVASLMAQLLDALECAHAQGHRLRHRVHRDFRSHAAELGARLVGLHGARALHRRAARWPDRHLLVRRVAVRAAHRHGAVSRQQQRGDVPGAARHAAAAFDDGLRPVAAAALRRRRRTRDRAQPRRSLCRRRADA
jgi:predicted Ser/Thr protein kinase